MRVIIWLLVSDQQIVEANAKIYVADKWPMIKI